MPVSDYHQISDVLHVIDQANPRSALDIGVGFGKWGILLREVLEVYHERLHPKTWITRVDGIEIFEPYRNPLWEFAYDNVYIGDAFGILDGLGKYDVILCCDVIEHFDKQAGMAFLDKLLKHGDLVINYVAPWAFSTRGCLW